METYVSTSCEIDRFASTRGGVGVHPFKYIILKALRCGPTPPPSQQKNPMIGICRGGPESLHIHSKHFWPGSAARSRSRPPPLRGCDICGGSESDSGFWFRPGSPRLRSSCGLGLYSWVCVSAWVATSGFESRPGSLRLCLNLGRDLRLPLCLCLDARCDIPIGGHLNDTPC